MSDFDSPEQEILISDNDSPTESVKEETQTADSSSVTVAVSFRNSKIHEITGCHSSEQESELPADDSSMESIMVSAAASLSGSNSKDDEITDIRISVDEGQLSVEDLTESIWNEIDTTYERMRNPTLQGENKRWDVPSWLDHQLVSNRMRPSFVYLGLLKPRFLEGDLNSYKRRLIARDLFNAKKDDIDTCLKALRTLLVEVRCWYDERYTNDLSDVKLLKIMFLDGCYIIATLIEMLKSPADVLLPQWDDELLLFHNQIPLVILQTILNATSHWNKQVPSALGKFSHHWSLILKYLLGELKFPQQEFCSLLHLYHYIFTGKHILKRKVIIFIPRGKLERPTRNVRFPASKVIHSATKLKKRGVIFKKKGKFWEIIFRCGVLSIPSLAISERKIMSLLALEQCSGGDEMPISTVVYFIAFMVITDKDLDLLENCDIVDRGDIRDTEDILNFFAEVRKNLKIDIKVNKISNVCNEINLFLTSPWAQCWTLLKNKFGRPLVTIMASLLLLLILRMFGIRITRL